MDLFKEVPIRTFIVKQNLLLYALEDVKNVYINYQCCNAFIDFRVYCRKVNNNNAAYYFNIFSKKYIDSNKAFAVASKFPQRPKTIKILYEDKIIRFIECKFAKKITDYIFVVKNPLKWLDMPECVESTLKSFK